MDTQPTDPLLLDSAFAEDARVDASLITMFDEVRRRTLRVIDVQPRVERWAPPGTDNHLLWHAGHAYVIVESLVCGAIRGVLPTEPRLPGGWVDFFGFKSEPANVPANRWPALSEVRDALIEQHTRLRSAMGALSMQDLADFVRPPKDMRPRRQVILHAFHDEACHSGEAWLLRKQWEAMH